MKYFKAKNFMKFYITTCHTPVFTWLPRISGRRSSGMESVTAQCHLRAVFILATSENFPFQQQLRQ